MVNLLPYGDFFCFRFGIGDGDRPNKININKFGTQMLFQKTKHKNQIHDWLSIPLRFALVLAAAFLLKPYSKITSLNWRCGKQNFEYTEGEFHSDKMEGLTHTHSRKKSSGKLCVEHNLKQKQQRRVTQQQNFIYVTTNAKRFVLNIHIQYTLVFGVCYWQYTKNFDNKMLNMIVLYCLQLGYPNKIQSWRWEFYNFIWFWKWKILSMCVF